MVIISSNRSCFRSILYNSILIKRYSLRTNTGNHNNASWGSRILNTDNKRFKSKGGNQRRGAHMSFLFFFFSGTYPIIGGDGMLLIIYLNIASILCWYEFVFKKKNIKKDLKQLDISEETPDSVLIIIATLTMISAIIVMPLHYGYLLFRKLF